MTSVLLYTLCRFNYFQTLPFLPRNLHAPGSFLLFPFLHPSKGKSTLLPAGINAKSTGIQPKCWQCVLPSPTQAPLTFSVPSLHSFDGMFLQALHGAGEAMCLFQQKYQLEAWLEQSLRDVCVLLWRTSSPCHAPVGIIYIKWQIPSSFACPVSECWAHRQDDYHWILKSGFLLLLFLNHPQVNILSNLEVGSKCILCNSKECRGNIFFSNKKR